MTQHLKNFGFTHKSGILMAISSLPSPYGIGTFGKPCYKFVDFLADCGQTCWQVLPLNPTAYGDSPYQSPASFAGNPYFLDLDRLHKEKLLTLAELATAKRPNGEKVDYGWLFFSRFQLLRKAYSRFHKNNAFYSFKRSNADWLEDYALFMALKVKNGYRPWVEWAEDERVYAKAVANKKAIKDEIGFWEFLQYQFFTQWKDVVRYAHKKGIKIIGDMPIYVAFDSVEVWSRPDQFLLDQNLNPTIVAGCPPDGFSPDGQLWGNPIYNWEKMKGENFAWWVHRVKHSFKLYDILRIDHFRGFAGYYCIPFGDSTARNGWWQQGVGKELFAVIKSALPHSKIIAEDLGFITEDVRELLDFTGYPGMKVLQFAFFDEDAEYLPRNYKDENCVVYTGTHDADTTKAWCDNLDGSTRERFMRECPQTQATPVYSLIAFALNSKANVAIIPLQDYQELDNSCRMNVPAFGEGNWVWRTKAAYYTKYTVRKILELNKQCGRAYVRRKK